MTFYTPSLAHRDKKINLNYPLPVSNDCNEPIRQKWITDTYQLLKVVLPPTSVDTAEELAQLSQYVINIVDFRDPDGTMTHWVNPDVVLNLGAQITPGPPPIGLPSPPTLTLSIASGNLDQYGMEYNPVAINETLAYSFKSKATSTATAAPNNRFFIELVNTLTAAYNSDYDYGSPPTTNLTNNYFGNASVLDLGGFNYTVGDPYSGACWDLVFTPDIPMARPDPYRGELVYANPSFPTVKNYYALIPLNRDAFGASNPLAPNNGDVTLLPINPNAASPTTIPVPAAPPAPPPPAPPLITIPANYFNYFYVIGNPPQGNELNPPTTTSTTNPVSQTLSASYDPVPMSPVLSNTVPFAWHQGILPVAPNAPVTNPPTPPLNYQASLPALTAPSITAVARPQYFWVCLRRPANPFAPVSASNPMCVVDSMRFPYIDGTGSNYASQTDGGTPPQSRHERDIQHNLFGPAPPAVSRRPRRPDGQRHGRHHGGPPGAGPALRLHRAARRPFDQVGDVGQLRDLLPDGHDQRTPRPT